MADDRPDLGQLVKDWKQYARAIKTFRDYDEGRHELRFATKDFADKYGSVVRSMRENLCPAAISAFVDGLSIKEWGDQAAEDVADEEGLTRLADLVHTEAYRSGDAYVLVWKNAAGEPIPHFHRADQFWPKTSATDPGILEYAAKIWVDEKRLGRINVYYADRVERFATMNPFTAGTDPDLPEQTTAWRAYDDDGDPDVIAHDFGAVPVCWWKQNAADQHSHGRSILTDVIPLQDGLNASLAHMLVLGEGYAKPFWYLLNFQPKGGTTNPLAVAREYQEAMGTLQQLNEQAARKFDPAKQRIFTHDGPGPFGQLDPPDMAKLIEVQDAFALKVARVIGVPSYWFTQTSGQVPSGESLRVLTTRRNSAIGRFQRSAAPVWRGLAFLLGMGDDVSPQWESPMPLDPIEKIDIAERKKRLGYALQDAIAGLDEADEAGIIQRADEAASTSAAAIGRSFREGAGL